MIGALHPAQNAHRVFGNETNGREKMTNNDTQKPFGDVTGAVA